MTDDMPPPPTDAPDSAMQPAADTGIGAFIRGATAADEIAAIRCLFGAHALEAHARMSAEMFDVEAHRIVFEAFDHLAQSGRPTTIRDVAGRVLATAPDEVAFTPGDWAEFGDPIDSEHVVEQVVGRLVDYHARRQIGAAIRRAGRNLTDLTLPATELRMELLGDLEAAADTDAPALSTMSLADLAAEPPLEPLIGSVLPQGQSTLFAETGVGKTWVAMTMALAIATGTPWYGHDVVEGTVLYLIGEGRGSLSRRLAAWQQRNGPVPDDRFRIYDRTLSLGDPQGAATLRLLCRRWRPTLVVVDTWGRYSGLEREQDVGEQARAWQILDRIRDEYGTSSLVVHHSNAQGGIRNRGLPETNADVTLQAYLPDEEDRTRFSLRPRKVRDGVGFDPMTFTWSRPGDGPTVLEQVGQVGRTVSDDRCAAAFAHVRASGPVPSAEIGAKFGPAAVLRLTQHPDFRTADGMIAAR